MIDILEGDPQHPESQVGAGLGALWITLYLFLAIGGVLGVAALILAFLAWPIACWLYALADVVYAMPPHSCGP